MRETVVDHSLTYTIARDDPMRRGDRLCALARVRLLDDLFDPALPQRPPSGEAVVDSDAAGAEVRVTHDGEVGVVGIPRRAFPLLQAQPYIVNVTIDMAGYVPARVAVTVPADPGFPQSFNPPAPVTISLHRAGTLISGRVTQRVGDLVTGVTSATVEVTQVVRFMPRPDAMPTLVANNLLSLREPLLTGRATAGGQVAAITLTPVAGSDKTLVGQTDAGGTELNLSDRQLIAAANVLLVDVGDSEMEEYVTIASLVTARPLDQPAAVTATLPLSRAHRAGAVVRRVTVSPPGAAKAFGESASAGDACVLLNNLTGLATSGTVRITDGVSDEYHVASKLVAVTNSDGFYRLPRLARVAQIEVTATKGAKSRTSMFQPDYTTPENRLDFLLPS
jgi:hypothetical protein